MYLLKDNAIYSVPQNGIEINGINIKNPTSEQLRIAGYKDLMTKDTPQVDENHTFEEVYIDMGLYIQQDYIIKEIEKPNEAEVEDDNRTE